MSEKNYVIVEVRTVISRTALTMHHKLYLRYHKKFMNRSDFFCHLSTSLLLCLSFYPKLHTRVLILKKNRCYWWGNELLRDQISKQQQQQLDRQPLFSCFPPPPPTATARSSTHGFTTITSKRIRIRVSGPPVTCWAAAVAGRANQYTFHIYTYTRIIIHTHAHIYM